MTYDARERSVESGSPIEFYEFKKGVETWRYTSADGPVIYLSNTYEPIAISRGRISNSAEINQANLTIKMPTDNPVPELWLQQPPGDIVSVTVFRQHRGDAEVKVHWMGRVLTCKQPDVVATLNCESITTSQKRMGLSRKYGIDCQHVLYRNKCGVDRLAYRTFGTVSAVNGNQVTVEAAAGQADGYYNGGYLYWSNAAGNQDYRMIDSHVGNALTLLFRVQFLSVGDTVQIFPGCDRSLATCNSKFANDDNHGGWPFQSRVNPFNGSTIF